MIRKNTKARSVARNLFIICLCLVIILSLQSHLPFSGATTVQTKDVTLQQGQYYAIPLYFASPAIVAYATNSTAQVSTAFMNAQQYSAFQSTGDVSANSIYDQNGTRNFNELLVNSGTFYLVAAAYTSASDVTFLYDNFTDFSVQNATTYVGQFLNIQPGESDLITLNFETAGSNFNMTLFGGSNQTVKYSQ